MVRASWDVPPRHGQLLSSGILFLAVYLSGEGHVATQMGAELNQMSDGAGTQDRNGAWTLLSHTLPQPLPIPPPSWGREDIAIWTGLGVAQQGGSFSPILSMSRFSEVTGKKGILNTGRLPIPASCLVWLQWDQQNQRLVCLAPSSCQANRGSCYLKMKPQFTPSL